MTDDPQHTIEALEAENAELRHKLEKFERNAGVQKAVSTRATQAAWWIATGPELNKAIKRWLHDYFDRDKIEIDASADVIAAVIRRIFKVGAIGLIVALAPTLLLMMQLALLYQQNKLFESQNATLSAQFGSQEDRLYTDRRKPLELMLTERESCGKSNPEDCPLENSAKDRSAALRELIKLDRKHRSSVDLSHMDLPKVTIAKVDLSAANLFEVTFKDSDLTGANLTGANLTKADLRRATLSKTKLVQAVMTGADLQKAVLESANLEDANLQGADLTGGDLRKTKLPGANLTEAELEGANLKGANLEGAKLLRAVLKSVDLRDANLKNADLQRADLQGAKLGNANLEGADLRGAKLKRVNLSSTKLRDATYDKKTTWPEDFEPKDAGALKVPSPR